MMGNEGYLRNVQKTFLLRKRLYSIRGTTDDSGSGVQWFVDDTRVSDQYPQKVTLELKFTDPDLRVSGQYP